MATFAESMSLCYRAGIKFDQLQAIVKKELDTCPERLRSRGRAPHTPSSRSHGAKKIEEAHSGSLSSIRAEDVSRIVRAVLNKLPHNEFFVVGPENNLTLDAEEEVFGQSRALSLLASYKDDATAGGFLWISCWYYGAGSVGFDRLEAEASAAATSAPR